MAQFSNSQILSSVLNKYLQPIVNQFAGQKLAGMSFVQAIENKIKSTGWVSQQWSLMKEISPLVEPLTGRMVTPLLNNYLSKMPQESIPEFAHSFVDAAIENGNLSLFEGNVEFELEDLKELKRLLDYNLPLKAEDVYEVKTEEPVVAEKSEEPVVKTK